MVASKHLIFWECFFAGRC